MAEQIESNEVVDYTAERMPEQASWPMVIGILSIIYAAGGLTCAGGAIGYPILFPRLPEMMRAGIETLPGALTVFYLLSGGAGVILGMLLLLGAINTMRRRVSGPRMLKLWAVGRLLLLVGTLGGSMLLLETNVELAMKQREYFVSMSAEQGRTVPMPTREEVRQQTVVMTVIVSVVLAAYPIFIASWLSRRRIREQIESWPLLEVNSV